MPAPLLLAPLAAGGISAILVHAIRWVFLAHVASFVVRAFAVLGLAYFTNEYLLEPVLALINSNLTGMPGDLADWMDAFGFDNVISILVSAHSIAAVKRLFLGKAPA
jgi:hypothetical protein